MDIKQIDQFAKQLIVQAGKKIRNAFSYNLQVETKSSKNDLVTNIDRETELFFIDEIHKFDPSHKVFGEEGMGERPSSLEGVVWIIDPIDGTMNFVKQHRHFFISVGIYKDGEGVAGYIFDVMREDLFYAIAGEGAWYNDSPMRKLQPVPIDEAVIGVNARWVAPNTKINHEKIIDLVKTVRGTRSYGSAAMEIAFVVSGKLDAYMSMRLAPWDISAGIILAKEVGAIATTLKGEAFTLMDSETFIIANPYIHKQLLEQYIEPK